MFVRNETASLSSGKYLRVSNIDDPDTLGVDGESGRTLVVVAAAVVVAVGVVELLVGAGAEVVLLALLAAIRPPDMVGNGRLGRFAINVVVRTERWPFYVSNLNFNSISPLLPPVPLPHKPHFPPPNAPACAPQIYLLLDANRSIHYTAPIASDSVPHPPIDSNQS
jgi:hypothetical protein